MKTYSGNRTVSPCTRLQK